MPKKLNITAQEKELLKIKPKMNIVETPIEKLNISLSAAFLIEPQLIAGLEQSNARTKTRLVHDYEVVLFLENGGKTIIDQVEYPIKKGDIRFLKPNQIVYNYRYNDAYVVHFSPVCENNRNFIISNEYINEIPSMLKTNNMQSYIQIFKELIRANRIKNKENELFIKFKLLELLYLLYTEAIKSKKQGSLGLASVALIENACDFIKFNYDKPIKLKNISESVNLHPNYFHRIFKKCKGITPQQYLTNVRLANAQDLLTTTTKSIYEISELCGFESTSYFIVVFKKYNKETPNEYRTSMQNEYIIKM